MTVDRTNQKNTEPKEIQAMTTYESYEPTSEDLQDWSNHLMMMELEDCLTIDNYYGPEDGDEEEDHIQEEEYEEFPDACTSPQGHVFKRTGTAFGGDDERWGGEGRCFCIYCGADGDA